MFGKLLPFRGGQDKANHATSDEALLAACAAGDQAALGLLYDRLHEAVYRFLAQFANGVEHELDDLVQSTFVEVYRSAKQFTQKSQAKTWILGIAANTARYHIRKEARRRTLTTTFAERLTPTCERPDDLASRREELARVEAALETLSVELRIVFVMCDIEGMRGVDVAQSLQLPEGTVWRRLHEARKHLRTAITKGGER
jgi:RNA polymerase sigma-70 factor, ECF subfamily